MSVRVTEDTGAPAVTAAATTLGVDRLHEVLKAGERHAAEKHRPQKPMPTAAAIDSPKPSATVLPPAMTSPYLSGGVRAASAPTRAGKGLGDTASGVSVVEAMMGKRVAAPTSPASQLKPHVAEPVAAAVETVEDLPAVELEEEVEEVATKASVVPEDFLLDSQVEADQEAMIAAAIFKASTPMQSLNVADAPVEERVEAPVQAAQAELIVDPGAKVSAAKVAATGEAVAQSLDAWEEAPEDPEEQTPTYTLLGTEGADDEQLPVSLSFERMDGYHVAYIQHFNSDNNDSVTAIAVFPGDEMLVVSATNAPLHEHHVLDVDGYELDLMEEIENSAATGVDVASLKEKALAKVGNLKAAASAAAGKVASLASQGKSRLLRTKVFANYSVPDKTSPFFKRVMNQLKVALKNGYNPGNVAPMYRIVRVKTPAGAGKPVGSVDGSLFYSAVLPNMMGGFLSATTAKKPWNMGMMAPFTKQTEFPPPTLDVGGVVFYMPEELKAEKQTACLGHFFGTEEDGPKNVRTSAAGEAAEGGPMTDVRNYRILGPEFVVVKVPRGGYDVMLQRVGAEYENGLTITWKDVEAWERKNTLTNKYRDMLCQLYLEELAIDTTAAARKEHARFQEDLLERQQEEDKQAQAILQAQKAGKPLPVFKRIDVMFNYDKPMQAAYNRMEKEKMDARNIILMPYGVTFEAFQALHTIISTMSGASELWNLVLPYTPVGSGVYLDAKTYLGQQFRWTNTPQEFDTYSQDAATRRSYVLRWKQMYNTKYTDESDRELFGELGANRGPDNVAGVGDPIMVHVGGTSYRQDLEKRILDARQHMHALPANTDFESYLTSLIARNKKRGMKGSDSVEEAKLELKRTIDQTMRAQPSEMEERYNSAISWYEEQVRQQKRYLGDVLAENQRDDPEAGRTPISEMANDAAFEEATRDQRLAVAEDTVNIRKDHPARQLRNLEQHRLRLLDAVEQ